MNPTDLERQIDRALSRLPQPRAPRTLAPRVMQAVAALQALGARVDTGWRQWSLAWRMLALVLACSLVAAMAVGLPIASAWLADQASARAALAIWRTCLAPLAIPAVVVMAAMFTTCALLVAALKSLVWEGRWTVQS
jgi:hypothetical protein